MWNFPFLSWTCTKLNNNILGIKIIGLFLSIFPGLQCCSRCLCWHIVEHHHHVLINGVVLNLVYRAPVRGCILVCLRWTQMPVDEVFGENVSSTLGWKHSFWISRQYAVYLLYTMQYAEHRSSGAGVWGFFDLIPINLKMLFVIVTKSQPRTMSARNKTVKNRPQIFSCRFLKKSSANCSKEVNIAWETFINCRLNSLMSIYTSRCGIELNTLQWECVCALMFTKEPALLSSMVPSISLLLQCTTMNIHQSYRRIPQRNKFTRFGPVRQTL